MKAKSNKNILIIAGVAAAGLIAVLLLTRRSGGGNAGDPTGYGAMAQMFGDAAAKVNQTINEGLDIITQAGTRSKIAKADATMSYINEQRKNSPLYSKQLYF